MPSRAETEPMTRPASPIPAAAGRPRCATGLTAKNSCSATRISNTPKHSASPGLLTWRASHAPPSAPARMPGNSARAAGQCTLPRRWCASNEEIAVGMMAASDEPTARCIRCPPGTPCPASSHASAGTITSPPPIPSSPASNPATGAGDQVGEQFHGTGLSRAGTQRCKDTPKPIAIEGMEDTGIFKCSATRSWSGYRRFPKLAEQPQSSSISERPVSARFRPSRTDEKPL